MTNTKPLPNPSNNGSTHQRIYQLSNSGRGLHLLQPTLLAKGFYSVWASPYLLRGQVTRDNYETCVFITALDYFLVILCILLLKLLEVLKIKSDENAKYILHGKFRNTFLLNECHKADENGIITPLLYLIS